MKMAESFEDLDLSALKLDSPYGKMLQEEDKTDGSNGQGIMDLVSEICWNGAIWVWFKVWVKYSLSITNLWKNGGAFNA